MSMCLGVCLSISNDFFFFVTNMLCFILNVKFSRDGNTTAAAACQAIAEVVRGARGQRSPSGQSAPLGKEMTEVG